MSNDKRKIKGDIMTTAANSPANPAAHEEELPETTVSARAKAKTMRQLQAQMLPEPEDDEVEPSTDTTSEDTTWQKRYSDLRRHLQAKEAAFNKKVQEMEAKMEQLSASSNKPMPKTQEEFEAWKAEYPDIVPFIEQIAEMKAMERATPLETELTTVKAKLQETEEEKAYTLLKVLVPDIEDIPAMPEYSKWLDSLSKPTRERILNSNDPYEVRDYMNMFKATLGKPVAAPKKNAIDALETRVKHSGSAIPRNTTQYKFKESDITKMSPQEYADKEAEIEEAHRAGKVLLDITGKKTYLTDV